MSTTSAQVSVNDTAIDSANKQQQPQGTAGAPQPGAILDMASVLSKIQALEAEKRELSTRLQAQDSKLEKLTESKRAEMQSLLEGTISTFLKDLQTKDEKTKEDLRAGLERLAHKGDESGVWEVMACASAAHVERVNELERLRTEVNSYKDREKALQGGVFGLESSRVSPDVGDKRKADDMSYGDSANGVPNIFDEFASTMMSRGGISAVYTE